jgi:pimeloyl-ACP methyl ester carboxylesterase
MPIIETTRGKLFVAQRREQTYLKTCPTLICIHGAGGSHQHWGYLARTLSPSYHVVSVDLPGHGRSPGPGRCCVGDYSNIVIALLDALEIERAVFVGHSMGGAIAIWTAITQPERVEALALIGCGERLPVHPAIIHYLEQNDLPAAVKVVVEHSYTPKTPPLLRASGEAAFLQNDIHTLYGDMLVCSSYDVRGQAGQVTCPALVMCGTEDHATPPAFSEQLAANLPRSTYVPIDGTGHMALIEKPDEVGHALDEFLTSLCKTD